MRLLREYKARLGALSIFSLAVGSLAGCADNSGSEGAGASDDSDVAFCTSPAPIPDGYGYPATEQEVSQWVTDRDEAATRAHGWNLFAALQSEAGDGWVWQSWCTETQAFAVGGQDQPDGGGTGKAAMLAAQAERPMRAFKLDNGLTSGEEPINFKDAPSYKVPDKVLEKYEGSACVITNDNGTTQLANGPTMQNNGDILIAGVIYSDEAYQWIRSTQIYDANILQEMRPPSDETRQIDPFPSRAIGLKPMLWPIKGDGYTALPIWDDLTEDYDKYSGFEIQSQWPRAVAVTTGEVGSDPVSVTMLEQSGVTQNKARLGPNVYESAAQVSIDDFYSYEPAYEKLHECDRAIVDMSAYYAYGRLFEQGDRLALVAMHIQTKEQPSWTFQSIWWSDTPDEGPYAAGRPEIPGATGPWQNYLMTSTYGWPTVPGGSTWPIAYNPYIELAAAHPIKTNCQNCHMRASFPGMQDSYLQTGGPGALDVFSYDGNSIFGGLIGTDALWSISDRALCPDGTKPPCDAGE